MTTDRQQTDGYRVTTAFLPSWKRSRLAALLSVLSPAAVRWIALGAA